MSLENRDGEMLGRQESEIAIESRDNAIFIVLGQLGLEAIENKLLVLLDKFKSGYECKDCNGTGIYINCECERRGTPGRFLNGNIDRACKYCEGLYETRRGRTCVSCKGVGDTIILPDNAKAIPTSGIIVSIGPKCTTRKITERVLFGAHTGYYIPFKGNVKIKCMREDEPLCIIHSLETNIALGDFLQIEDSIETLNRN